MPCIGLANDLLVSNGQPLFGNAPLELFRSAGLDWTFLPADGGEVAPDQVATCDALFINGSRLTRESLKNDAGRLRIVARNGVGFDAVDVSALTEAGILLVNTPTAVRNPVATSAMGFILNLSLRFPLKSRLAREGRWAERGDYTGIGLPGRTLGVVGLGGIGREIVRLMQPFGMRILGYDPFLSAESGRELGVGIVQLDELMRQSDFVVVSCPLNESTHHLIGAAALAAMKSSAYLINVARGPIVDEAALIDALRSGTLAGAGLDVFENEPVEPGNPLLAMDNVIATPHSIGWTDLLLGGIAESAIAGIVDAMAGRLPDHIVNPAAIDHERVRAWRGVLA